MIQVSGSKTPLALACAQSLTPPKVRIEGDDAAARAGTGAHAILAARIVGGDFDAVANSLAEDIREEAQMLAAMGWRLWEDSLAQYFPEPACEHRPPPLESNGVRLTTGGVDIFSIVE